MKLIILFPPILFLAACSAPPNITKVATQPRAPELNSDDFRSAIIGHWYAHSALYEYRSNGTIFRYAAFTPSQKWAVKGGDLYIDGELNKIVKLTDTEFFYNYPKGGTQRLFKNQSQWNGYDD